MDLSKTERDLLDWLSREDFSQYGECHGKDLDSLVAKGLAQLHGDNGHLGSFIAKGRGPMYQSVSLTEAGIAEVVASRQAHIGNVFVGTD